MTRADRIRIFRDKLQQAERFAKDITNWSPPEFDEEFVSALTDSIAEAEMIEKVAEGMPKKREAWISKDRLCGSPEDNACRYLHLINKDIDNPNTLCNKCEHLIRETKHELTDEDIAFNEALALCQASLVSRVDAEKIADMIDKSYTERERKDIAQALTTKLGEVKNG